MIANVTTLIFYWGNRILQAKNNSPREFLVKELHFDKQQKDIFFKLAKEHNEASKPLRKQIKEAKHNFFNLLKDPNASDSTINVTAHMVSVSIESLDKLTFDHFKKVRAICTKEQKPKFDEIIHKMVNAVTNQEPSGSNPMKNLPNFNNENQHPDGPPPTPMN